MTIHSLADLPVDSWIPSGSTGITIFGGSGSIHAALADSSDSTGVHIGTTDDQGDHRFATVNTFAALPAGARIQYLAVTWRMRHDNAPGWMYPGVLVGYGASGRHQARLSAASPGPAAPGVQEFSSTHSRTASDGVKWRECSTFEVEWGYAGHGWDATNYPYVTRYYLTAWYTLPPEVTSISPSGTVVIARPTLSWAVTEGPQSAYRVIFVPTGSTDANSVAVGSAGFDPTTGSDMASDSGKVYSVSSVYVPPARLGRGVWKPCIFVWSGSGADEMEALDWEVGSFTVNSPTVDAPTIVLADHAGSNSVSVTIAPGATGATETADTIEVQMLDAATGRWVAGPIPGSEVSGTGTSVFYDSTRAPGATVSYRARGVATVTGGEAVSDWVVATLVVGDLHQWWLRSTTNHALNRSLADHDTLLVRGDKITRGRPQVAGWGIGQRGAIVVADITKSDVHQMSVWAIGRTNYLALRALLEDGDDLALVSPWGEMWRVQVGQQTDEEVVVAGPRGAEVTAIGFVRVVGFTLTEVVTP